MQTEGVNDRAQLAELGREMNRRIVTRWMRDGVTVMDPATTWIDADVVLTHDVTILPGTQLLGATVVAEDAVIGPDTTLKDCEIGAGARVVRTHGELAVIGDGATVGPFSYLRPGTTCWAPAARSAPSSRPRTPPSATAPRCRTCPTSATPRSATGANIGAGTIFANYDGVAKHRTTRRPAGAKTGSNNTFVAPVDIGDGAMTGGGTVVRATCRRARWRSRAARSATSRLGAAQARGHPAGRGGGGGTRGRAGPGGTPAAAGEGE